MTHRTVEFSAGPVHVFDTGFAAMRWAKRQTADCIVVARGKFYFQRKAGVEMTVRLNATDNAQNRHLVTAANTVADKVEALLAQDKAA